MHLLESVTHMPYSRAVHILDSCGFRLTEGLGGTPALIKSLQYALALPVQCSTAPWDSQVFRQRGELNTVRVPKYRIRNILDSKRDGPVMVPTGDPASLPRGVILVANIVYAVTPASPTHPLHLKGAHKGSRAAAARLVADVGDVGIFRGVEGALRDAADRLLDVRRDLLDAPVVVALGGASVLHLLRLH